MGSRQNGKGFHNVFIHPAAEPSTRHLRGMSAASGPCGAVIAESSVQHRKMMSTLMARSAALTGQARGAISLEALSDEPTLVPGRQLPRL